MAPVLSLDLCRVLGFSLPSFFPFPPLSLLRLLPLLVLMLPFSKEIRQSRHRRGSHAYVKHIRQAEKFDTWVNGRRRKVTFIMTSAILVPFSFIIHFLFSLQFMYFCRLFLDPPQRVVIAEYFFFVFPLQGAIDSWGKALAMDAANKSFNSKLHCNRAVAYAKVRPMALFFHVTLSILFYSINSTPIYVLHSSILQI